MHMLSEGTRPASKIAVSWGSTMSTGTGTTAGSTVRLRLAGGLAATSVLALRVLFAGTLVLSAAVEAGLRVRLTGAAAFSCFFSLRSASLSESVSISPALVQRRISFLGQVRTTFETRLW